MDKKQLGRNIKLIRQTKNITREDLAKKLNISYSSIEKYEQGLRGFKVEIIDKFAEALGVPLNEILGTNATTNDIGRKITIEQSINDVSHEELAEKTGIDEKHLRVIKAGQINPTQKELNKIANALGLPLSYFIKNLASALDDEVIQDEHEPIELIVKYGTDKDVMTRDELYSLLNFYINKTSILSKEKSIAIQKLEAISEIINNK